MSKVVKVVSQAQGVHMRCLECVGVEYTGEDAEAKAYKHANENDGHRVLVREFWQGIFQRKEMK